MYKRQDLWRKIAAQDPSFGHPDKFCYDPELSNWMSATITTLDQRIVPYIKKICKRDPFTGKVVTGGIVSVKDSSWLLSWTLNRQQQFRDQPKDQLCVWVYSLFSDKPGDYVKKPMRECTGEEICQEWLYHIGVPVDQIEDLAANSANTVPCMMPYIDAFFMPRAAGDRPDVVPEGAVNFAFIGQFAETKRDTIFTTDAPGPRATVEAVKDVMRFWLDMGCDGFRVDMASSLVKNDTHHKKYTCAIWRDIAAMLDKEYPEAALVSEWNQPRQSLKNGFDMDLSLIHI